VRQETERRRQQERQWDRVRKEEKDGKAVRQETERRRQRDSEPEIGRKKKMMRQ